MWVIEMQSWPLYITQKTVFFGMLGPRSAEYSGVATSYEFPPYEWSTLLHLPGFKITLVILKPGNPLLHLLRKILQLPFSSCQESIWGIGALAHTSIAYVACCVCAVACVCCCLCMSGISFNPEIRKKQLSGGSIQNLKLQNIPPIQNFRIYFKFKTPDYISNSKLQIIISIQSFIL